MAEQNDEMDSLYGSEGASAPANSAEEGASNPTEKAQSIDQEEAALNTAVVPNRVLQSGAAGLKEGDTVTIRIVKNFGDESEIEVVSGGEGEGMGGPMMGRNMMEEANSELDMMGKE